MKKTAVFEQHIKHKGMMVEFNGWSMPMQYSGIIDEHKTVREKVGLFDVSHMGQLDVSGKNTLKMLSNLFTSDPAKIKDGNCIYAHILNDEGYILDDMIALRLNKERFLCVPNAGTVDLIYDWFWEHKLDCKLENLTDDYTCLALQGPFAQKTLQKLTKYPLEKIKFFEFENIDIDVGESKTEKFIAARSGYTGEDGFEIYIKPKEFSAAVWNKIMEAGAEFGIKPIGLGARDTLRLEKGFLLSGQDFYGKQSSLDTNTEWVIDWEHDFIGKDLMLLQKEKDDYDRFVAIKLQERGIVRHEQKIFKDDEEIGFVTSGSIAPMLGVGIALGYVRKEYSAVGCKMEVEIRGRRKKAEIVSLPFV